MQFTLLRFCVDQGSVCRHHLSSRDVREAAYKVSKVDEPKHYGRYGTHVLHVHSIVQVLVLYCQRDRAGWMGTALFQESHDLEGKFEYVAHYHHFKRIMSGIGRRGVPRQYFLLKRLQTQLSSLPMFLLHLRLFDAVRSQVDLSVWVFFQQVFTLSAGRTNLGFDLC